MFQKLARLSAILLLSVQLNGQGGGLFINREFEVSSGSPVFNPILNPLGLQWSKSIHTINGDLVTVGHTWNSTSENIYVIRLDDDGNKVFENQYDIASAGYNDYGTDICEASNGDLLICGATDKGTTNDYDVVVLRISASGSFINEATKDGFGKIDVAVGIKEEPSGNIVLAANTEQTPGFSDYWVLRFSSSLSFLNAKDYDYAGLMDVAIGLEIYPGTGEVHLIGASASALNACDYTIARFSGSALTFVGDVRSSLPGTAMDQALAFCRDAANNTYITGKSWNGTDFDIKTVMIDASMNIAWADTMNVSGYDDVANTIALDPVSGDVIIGGFTTRTGNVKDMICVRYNSSGSRLNTLVRAGEDPAADAFIRKLCTNPAGQVYFVAGEQAEGGLKQVSVGKIMKSGLSKWQKRINNDFKSDVLPSDIEFHDNTVFVISIVDSLTDSYLTTAYTEFELDTAMIRSNTGAEVCKSRELIVRFQASALDSSFIDNTQGSKQASFGDLQDFMKSTPFLQLRSRLSDLCPDCDIKAVKVFPGLTTTYTSSVSRLGETVPMPDFWTTLLLQFPTAITIEQAYGLLNTLPHIVAYSHPNFIARPPAVSSPNAIPLTPGIDPAYSFQQSLHGALYPDAHINMPEAWSIFPEGGYPHIRAGIFDTGLDWKHSDFGFTPASPFSGKVKGWDFETSQNLRFLPDGGDYQSHGTQMAGIIGAIRNNTIAIKGIAGGNDTLSPTPNPGVSLFGLKILNTQPFNATLNYIADAIVSSADDNNNSTIDYDYGLHLQNHSWGMPQNVLPWYADTNIALLSDAIHQVNRMNVTVIASRGNTGANTINYPAVTDDDWVLSVGGFAANGNWDSPISWGRNVDIAAPSDGNMITTVCTSTFSGNGITPSGLSSPAAAHASGVVALLMSYLNNTLVSYNNLAPEDCEQIIQRSAKAMANGVTLPNDSVGYGRLDAGKALRLVEKPCNTLHHFGTKYFSHTISKLQVGLPDTVMVTERVKDLNLPTNYLNKGKYLIQAWEIHALVNHNLPTTDTIKAFWPRPSMSDVWEGIKNRKLLPRERDTILSCNQSQAHLKGYIYEIRDTLNQPIGWWPCDTSLSCSELKSLFEYSILTRSCSIITDLKKEIIKESFIKLFPNPANHSQTLVIETEKERRLDIELYDLMGRKIRQVFSGKTASDTFTINVDVSNLAKSLYIYVIRIDGEVVNKKFIKE